MSRVCPFHHCGKVIDPSLFACKDHWARMTEPDRKAIWDAFKRWQNGFLDPAELRAIHARVLLHYQTAEPPKPLPPSQDAEGLAKKVMLYVAKRKEYTKTKDQMIETKKRIGMALGHLENELVDLCKAILHPEQRQPRLFDPEEKQTGIPD